jgi:seryl-tRNA synthetase
VRVHLTGALWILQIPNELDPTVPVSNDEKDNLVVSKHGTCRPQTPDLLHHHELLYMIDGYEPERGTNVAGHRAYFLKGVGLLLNQALINYGINFLNDREYTPLQPPYVSSRRALLAEMKALSC